MRYTLRRPCKDCPFLDGKSYLTRARAREIVTSITDYQQTFSCHKLNEFDDDGDAIEGEDAQHCAGALIFLERLEQPNQMMRIAERIGLYDRTKLDMDAPVYEDGAAMIAGHGR